MKTLTNKELLSKDNSKQYLTYQNMFWLFMLGNVLGVILEGLWCYFGLGHWETHVVTIWGPFCLIYGIGLVGLYTLSVKLKDKNIIIKFLTIAFVLDAVEYFCSWLIDSALGMKAWDYSGCFMNIKGRISLSMTLLWGIGGILFALLFVPLINHMLDKMHSEVWKTACVVLSVFMAINIIATAVCMVRWSDRHRGVAPSTKLSQRIDAKYDDDFMKNRFVEWSFIR